jgi:hypothetical protein
MVTWTDGVGPLADGRHAAPGRKQPLEEHVDAAALALHQFEVMEDARETIVPAAALMEDVLRRHADWQPPRVHDLKAVRVQVQVKVASLRVGPVDERVHEQLANDELVVGRELRAQHAVGQLIALAEVRHFVPDRVDQLDGR